MTKETFPPGWETELEGDHARVRHARQQAVEQDSTNPVAHGERVACLIAQGLPGAAQKAWTEALSCVDPAGQRVHQDPSLAEELHHRVASAWLEVGDVAHALSVLRGIPATTILRSERLRDLEEQLLDAVEADALGESVYPRSVPCSERWSAPRRLPEQSSNPLAH